MKVLVVNSGSSSIKYELFNMHGPLSLATGLVERIGEHDSRLLQRIRQQDGGWRETVQQRNVPDHQQGLEWVLQELAESGCVASPQELDCIGHRVVHGGEKFRSATRIDHQVLEAIRDLSHLAPLHNPANVLGIEVMMRACPSAPQVAVFDTAFHQTIPPFAYRYAIPDEYYSRLGVRRYGFHGTSHSHVAKVAAEYLGRPLASLRLVTLHLGNGASAAAIDGGVCVDTSMGLTPLEGLMMGTRSGDLDPAILTYLAEQEQMSFADLDVVLNKKSGLLGVCGENDMREVLRRVDAGDVSATLALAMYGYRIKKYIGAYLAALGDIDALVFTAGVGENAPRVRQIVCEGLQRLGLVLDPASNAAPAKGAREIQAAAQPVSHPGNSHG